MFIVNDLGKERIPFIGFKKATTDVIPLHCCSFIKSYNDDGSASTRPKLIYPATPWDWESPVDFQLLMQDKPGCWNYQGTVTIAGNPTTLSNLTAECCHCLYDSTTNKFYIQPIRWSTLYGHFFILNNSNFEDCDVDLKNIGREWIYNDSNSSLADTPARLIENISPLAPYLKINGAGPLDGRCTWNFVVKITHDGNLPETKIKEISSHASITSTEDLNDYNCAGYLKWGEPSDLYGVKKINALKYKKISNTEYIVCANGSIKNGNLFWCTGFTMFNPPVLTVPYHSSIKSIQINSRNGSFEGSWKY